MNKTNERNIQSVIKKLEAEKDKVSKARDRLRDLVDDLNGHADSWDQAVSSLECAIDELSTLV